MFGEDLSESPRVPSPWDTIISTPPSPAPSPLAAAIPKLVPEQDDGNVEYKLQLLSPSPARFARLVTQMKWRLLEGGGQAYYELGVADSGMLVGLPRAELEQSLETLEMMAGEIGASVIVVKEIEVPAALAGLVGAQTDSWNGKRGLRRQQLVSEESSADDSTATNTETETEMSATDVDEDDHLASTVLFSDTDKNHSHSTTDPSAMFSMDDVSDSPADSSADDSPPIQSAVYTLDLEIASVFKPRPMRTKAASHVPPPVKNKRSAKTKKGKGKHIPEVLLAVSASPPADNGIEAPKQHSAKAQKRRLARDRKREERRQALVVGATAALDQAAAAVVKAVDDETLVSGLEALHVSVDPVPVAIITSEQTIPSLELTAASNADAQVVENTEEDLDEGDDDDVFPSPMTAVPGPFPEFASQLTVPVENGIHGGKNDGGTALSSRLIVEALVVRKMSLEEAFLDFGGFSLT